MKIGITGAGGHIGHRLSKRLHEGDHDVVALIRNNSREPVITDEVNTIIGDVRDKAVITEFINKVDGVVHLAYSDSGFANSVNIAATKNILQTSKQFGCDTFIFISTLSAHPRVYQSYSQSYIKSKYKASNWIRENNHGIHTVTLYPSRVIGPGDYKLTRFRPYHTVESNRFMFPPLYNISKTNYVHVDTVIDSILAGINHEIEGDHVVSGGTYSQKEYYKLISEKLQKRHTFVSVPFAALWVPCLLDLISKTGIIPKADYSNRIIDESYVEESLPADLACSAPISRYGIEEAIAESIEWYQNSGVL